MSEAGKKGNDIKWHYHHLPPREQYCDLSTAEVKQESGAPSSSSCIGASPAQLQQQRVEVGSGSLKLTNPIMVVMLLQFHHLHLTHKRN
jgi:hypothetical protein